MWKNYRGSQWVKRCTSRSQISQYPVLESCRDQFISMIISDYSDLMRKVAKCSSIVINITLFSFYWKTKFKVTLQWQDHSDINIEDRQDNKYKLSDVWTKQFEQFVFVLSSTYLLYIEAKEEEQVQTLIYHRAVLEIASDGSLIDWCLFVLIIFSFWNFSKMWLSSPLRASIHLFSHDFMKK